MTQTALAERLGGEPVAGRQLSRVAKMKAGEAGDLLELGRLTWKRMGETRVVPGK